MAASSQNYYQLYMNEVLTLAQTIVIKSEDTADALNTYVSTVLFGDVDTTDPTTWKYYLNLSGQYHPTDPPMTVTSMDTLETIEFTIANLQIHTATARGYVFGTRNYLELVSRFPDQEMLILGVLYPVDQAAAIAAADGTILGFPPGLVEANEYSFVAKLQDFITGYRYRWYNAQYTASDELYAAGFLGVMYLMLVPAIVSIRNNACGTNEAHSFHVQQYLSSNGDLGAYYDYLSTEQALWLYRNIKYIQRHPGAQSTFAALVENLLTARNLPLARYVMLHDTSSIVDTLYPTLDFQYQPVNFAAEVDAKTNITLDQLMNKEKKLARDNALYQTDYEASAATLMEYSLRNAVKTKVYESAVIDYSNSNPVTRAGLLFNHWLRLSSQGIYTAYVAVVNPITNETINLQAADAFCFAMYCFAQTTGIALTEIPKFLAVYVARDPLPDVADLMSVVDTKLVDISNAELALGWMPAPPTALISTDGFYQYVNSLYLATVYQRNLYSFQQHHVRRGMVWNMIDRLFCEVYCSAGDTGATYADWLSAQNIHLEGWTEADYQNIYVDIVSTATGADLNASSDLAAIQAAMIGILRTLSSYSVQFVTSINTSNVRFSDDGYVRVGDVDITAAAEYEVVDINIDVEAVATKAIQYERFEMIDDAMIAVEQSATIVKEIELPDLVHLEPISLEFFYQMNAITVQAHPYPPLVPNSEGLIPVVGIEYFLALTPQQQQQFKDVYNSTYDPNIEQNLKQVISTYYATGLQWIQRETPLSNLITVNPSPGLVWTNTVTIDLSAVIVQTTSGGLVWRAAATPLGDSIIILQSPSLYYKALPTSLAFSFTLNEANGLVYVEGESELADQFKFVDSPGLQWLDPNQSSS